MTKLLCITLLCSFLLSCKTTQPDEFYDKYNNHTYEIQDIEGWKLYVNTKLKKDPNWPLARRILSNQLFQTKRVISKKVIKKMQEVKIYLDTRENSEIGAEYHPYKEWLIENNFSPNKHEAIEIPSTENFIAYTKNQPWVILHELIHSYHHQVLGFNNTEIMDCYEKALKSGKYKNVRTISGEMSKHYGAYNHKEYFAEAAEAYFGVNDYYPFVKGELLHYDPAVCNILKRLEPAGK